MLRDMSKGVLFILREWNSSLEAIYTMIIHVLLLKGGGRESYQGVVGILGMAF